jgi:hydrogenase nickel incorporation protein HypA/HybF
MHELSIAMNIVDSASEYAIKHQLQKISKVEIAVGKLSGVVAESLYFVWSEACKDSLLQDSKLAVNMVPLKMHCNNCNKDTILEDILLICPHCDSLDTTVIEGKELIITKLEGI